MRVSQMPVAVKENGGKMLVAVPLLDFEVVKAKVDVGVDFFIALNGGICKPSACTGYWIDGNGAFVLRQGVGEFVSAPIPEAERPMIAAVKEILFVECENGIFVDISAVPLIVETFH